MAPLVPVPPAQPGLEAVKEDTSLLGVLLKGGAEQQDRKTLPLTNGPDPAAGVEKISDTCLVEEGLPEGSVRVDLDAAGQRVSETTKKGSPRPVTSRFI